MNTQADAASTVVESKKQHVGGVEIEFYQGQLGSWSRMNKCNLLPTNRSTLS